MNLRVPRSGHARIGTKTRDNISSGRASPAAQMTETRDIQREGSPTMGTANLEYDSNLEPCWYQRSNDSMVPAMIFGKDLEQNTTEQVEIRIGTRSYSVPRDRVYNAQLGAFMAVRRRAQQLWKNGYRVTFDRPGLANNQLEIFSSQKHRDGESYILQYRLSGDIDPRGNPERSWTCSCPYHFEHRMCKHTLGLVDLLWTQSNSEIASGNLKVAAYLRSVAEATAVSGLLPLRSVIMAS